jgi:hypothetical protein
MVPAGFGQNCIGTWRMKTQREIKCYLFHLFWSTAMQLALSRNGLNARYRGLRVNGYAIGSFKEWILCL